MFVVVPPPGVNRVTADLTQMGPAVERVNVTLITKMADGYVGGHPPREDPAPRGHYLTGNAAEN